MKQIFFASTMICVLFILSCSKKSVINSETTIESQPVLPLFVDCEQANYTGCEHVVWCYHNQVSSFAPLQVHSSFGNYKVLEILNCFVEVSNSKGELQELANSTLIKYYSTRLERGKKRNPPKVLGSGIHSNNPYYKAFSEWNSKESFELGLKFVEFKEIYCHDVGVCSNLRWDFITYVLLPKLTDESFLRYVSDYYKDLAAKGLYEDHNNADMLEKFVQAFIDLMVQDWNDGKLKLKVEEEQESEIDR
jgi:hypothetical protein